MTHFGLTLGIRAGYPINIMSFWKKLPQPIIGLAPMDGITDASYRLITARHGRPDVSFTEFTPVERIAKGYDPNLNDLQYSEIERPIVAQVFGSNPDSFYQVAHLLCELGFDGIDINMGCPARSIAGKGAGASLIQTPNLARQILRRTKEGVRDWATGQSLIEAGLPALIRDSVLQHPNSKVNSARRETGLPDRKEIPVSVKTRLGVHEVVIEDWIETLLSEAPSLITVHGRTLKQQYGGEADWECIARASEIVRKTDTLLFGNGDIRSAAMAVERLKQSEVHGVLLGRITMGNPWIFTTVKDIRKAVLKDEAPPSDPSISIEKRLAVVLEHAKLYETLKGPRPYHSIRKFLSAYFRGFPNVVSLHRELVHTKTFSDVQSAITSFITQNSWRMKKTGVPSGQDVCV